MSLTKSLRLKKIIAKEFLYFIACITIVLLVAISILSYNKVVEYKMKNLNEIIIKQQSIADSLIKPLGKKLNKQSIFVNRLVSHTEKKKKNISVSQRMKIWNRLSYLAESDSIKFKWHYKWDDKKKEPLDIQGIKTPEQFQKFILENSWNEKERLDYLEGTNVYNSLSEKYAKRNHFRSSLINDDDVVSLLIKVFLTCLTLLFILRYLFISVRWSINTLRSKN